MSRNELKRDAPFHVFSDSVSMPKKQLSQADISSTSLAAELWDEFRALYINTMVQSRLKGEAKIQSPAPPKNHMN